MSYRAEKYGALHVDPTGPFEVQRVKGHRYLLIMAHRFQKRRSKYADFLGDPTRGDVRCAEGNYHNN
eukprot:8427010-Prorocentrum_lima.AAC.1